MENNNSNKNCKLFHTCPCPIGTLHSVEENLWGDWHDKINGFLRDLKRVPSMVSRILSESLQRRWFQLVWKSLLSKVAIGGDGAPFGKNDQSCAWLISILSIGKRFLSNEDNFLIFGANCSEVCTTVDKYVSKLANYLAYLEKNVFQVNGANVKFEFSKLPNRKMLCFLAGQLSNRAKYFLQMYLVITSTLKFTFDQSKCHKWRPWVLSEEIKWSQAGYRLEGTSYQVKAN